MYYPETLEIARELGESLAGKVVVDISNPLNETYDGLATAPGTSAAEEVAAALPAGAGAVKAYNTTFSSTLLKARWQATARCVYRWGRRGGKGNGGAARARRRPACHRRRSVGAR